MQGSIILMSVAAVCCGALAGAAALRAGRSLGRWAFLGGMAILGAEIAVTARSFACEATAELRYWQELRLILTSALIAPWWFFSATFSRGNTPRINRQNLGWLAALFLLPLAVWLARADLVNRIGELPARVTTVVNVGWPGYLVHALGLVSAIVIVMNLERTFRAAVGTMRWRIKFALLGVGVLFITRIYTNSQVLLFRGYPLGLENANAVAVLTATPLILWSFIRAGHFEIDVYPSGPALRNSVTILLAGVYLLFVGVSANAISLLGGANAFALKALVVLVALVVLAVGLQSNRVHWKLRQFISRHFQRPLHDYRAVWKRFTDGTASRVEQADLCRAVAALVAEVFGALSVRVWLLDDRRDLLRIAATTAQHAGTNGTKPDAVEAAPIVERFRTSPETADIEREPWAAAMRDAHPSVFESGGHRVCVPLCVRGELLGVVTLGDRVNGAPFTVEDHELLRCIGDHVAASLLNIRLSERLLQSKQLEAFQSMAAFFVHDLKNAASTLNLMLQNLPVHFDDPEFRADALRGIGKTVDHINGLIGRLSALRSELKVEPVASDLNEIVTQALAGLGSLPESTLIKDMHPLPPIPVDREQVHKVITNLVLNAAEATSHEGRIRVATTQENGWVVLTVDDNGCGMSDEFIANSLFRPFQTTKKAGLGIGMFQSKMIVEAHGGRISVTSKPGAGTRFQVFLRAAPAAIKP